MRPARDRWRGSVGDGGAIGAGAVTVVADVDFGGVEPVTSFFCRSEACVCGATAGGGSTAGAGRGVEETESVVGVGVSAGGAAATGGGAARGVTVAVA